jgi:hypothetical protein
VDIGRPIRRLDITPAEDPVPMPAPAEPRREDPVRKPIAEPERAVPAKAPA